MTTAAPLSRSRVMSIDLVRGLVMIIMALDHIRDFFLKVSSASADTITLDPTNPASTTPALFFTRWITHFCAPTFLLLTGVSAYLYGQKRSKNELSLFLLKRGVFLVLVEMIVITMGWTFNPLYNLIILQVIWAIGASMIVMALLIRLPYIAILSIGLLIVFGHNLLDNPSISDPLKGGMLADLTYFGHFAVYNIDSNHFIIIIYSFLPWTGVMAIGYCLGKWYGKAMDPQKRRKLLFGTGLAVVVFFIALRFLNVYGDPSQWSSQPRGALYTLFSFLNTTKYPPSLLFLCMTIGPVLMLLSVAEQWQNKFTSVLNVFGRVPMFYYILHFYIIHTMVVIVFYMQGYGSNDIVTPNVPFLFRPPTFGYPLSVLYLIWAIVILILYPLCKWYDKYKSTHHQWWLKYL